MRRGRARGWGAGVGTAGLPRGILGFVGAIDGLELGRLGLEPGMLGLEPGRLGLEPGRLGLEPGRLGFGLACGFFSVLAAFLAAALSSAVDNVGALTGLAFTSFNLAIFACNSASFFALLFLSRDDGAVEAWGVGGGGRGAAFTTAGRG